MKLTVTHFFRDGHAFFSWACAHTEGRGPGEWMAWAHRWVPGVPHAGWPLTLGSRLVVSIKLLGQRELFYSLVGVPENVPQFLSRIFDI